MTEHDLIHLDLPASHRYLNVLGACISAMLERVEDVFQREVVTYNIQLAVHEVACNIVDHAYGGDMDERIGIALSVASGPRRFEAVLTDRGRAFDPAVLAQPNLDEPQEHGYGLFIARQLMDEVVYKRGNDENRWHLSKQL